MAIRAASHPAIGVSEMDRTPGLYRDALGLADCGESQGEVIRGALVRDADGNSAQLDRRRAVP